MHFLRPLEALQRVDPRAFGKVANHNDLRLAGELLHVARGVELTRYGDHCTPQIGAVPSGLQLLCRLTHDFAPAGAGLGPNRIESHLRLQSLVKSIEGDL